MEIPGDKGIRCSGSPASDDTGDQKAGQMAMMGLATADGGRRHVAVDRPRQPADPRAP
jgi:hypothetical protein